MFYYICFHLHFFTFVAGRYRRQQN